MVERSAGGAASGGEATPWAIALLAVAAFVHIGATLNASFNYLSIVSIIALSSICIFIFVAKRNYKDYEFRSLSNAFLAFAALFLFAEILWVASGFSDDLNLSYVLNIIWIIGYVPPILACWGTVVKYGEYLNLQKFIITLVSVFTIALLFLIPIGLAIAEADTYNSLLSKGIAMVYPYLDTILLLSLLMLVQIYKRGKLETYWLTVTSGIAIFTLGDLSNATSIALESDIPRNIFPSFNLLAFLLLAYGFGTLAYQKRKHMLMEPVGLYSVQQLFLINKGGLLMSYAGKESEIDGDIVGGMLTAVQNFIKDTFDSEGESKDTLNKLQYGQLELNIEDGEHVFLVLVLEGKGTEHLHMRMRYAVENIERRYENVVVDWGGKMDETRPITQELEYQFI